MLDAIQRARIYTPIYYIDTVAGGGVDRSAPFLNRPDKDFGNSLDLVIENADGRS